jgi:hypothetical protein
LSWKRVFGVRGGEAEGILQALIITEFPLEIVLHDATVKQRRRKGVRIEKFIIINLFEFCVIFTTI